MKKFKHNMKKNIGIKYDTAIAISMMVLMTYVAVAVSTILFKG